MNPTSEKRTRQDSCVRELELLAKGMSRCTDLPSEAETQTKYKPITQRSCPKWRGQSGKPWSDWYNTPLSFRIGSYIELVDGVALQTKHALLQQRVCVGKRKEKASCKQLPKQSCKECENPSAPSEPWRPSLTKHPLNESIRKCGTILTKARRCGVLFLATPRRTRVAKVSRTKTQRRVGNERHTKVTDASPGKDQHTTVRRVREKSIVLKNSSKTQRTTANIPT